VPKDIKLCCKVIFYSAQEARVFDCSTHFYPCRIFASNVEIFIGGAAPLLLQSNCLTRKNTNRQEMFAKVKHSSLFR